MKLPYLKRSQTEKRQHNTQNPETDDDSLFRPSQKFEMMMQRRHLENSFPAPAEGNDLENNGYYLDHENTDASIGTVSIQIDASNPLSFEFAHAEIEPIIECINRQLSINAELSSVRRLTSEERKGLMLLMQMDEVDASAGSEEILRSALELAAEHFGVELAAVVLPSSTMTCRSRLPKMSCRQMISISRQRNYVFRDTARSAVRKGNNFFTGIVANDKHYDYPNALCERRTMSWQR